MLGVDIHNIQDKTSFLTMDEIQSFKEMDNDFQNGYICFMLIHQDLIDNKTLNPIYPDHWVLYQGNQSIDALGNYNFEIFTWGRIKQNVIASPACIKDNFWGYIKLKI